jgi:hypothetical protein
MKVPRLVSIATIGVVLPLMACASSHRGGGIRGVPADQALMGVPLTLTPDQLPAQFRSQLRDDVKSSRGMAVLRQSGNDVAYSFAWIGMTSPVISGHFHKAPHGQVGVRAYSICGVPQESPDCPSGSPGSITGVWKNADLEAFNRGEITIAFHTKVYPAPIGEIAAYIPAARSQR